MIPTITAFKASPDGGKGMARDMPIRWAFEEVNQPYNVRLVTFEEMKKTPHLTLQPFGQIPTYEEGNLELFESGAIVHHIAMTHRGLLPVDEQARARAVSWMFSAVSTIEPPILDFETAGYFERDKDWYDERKPMLKDRIRARLTRLSQRLGNKEWLDDKFSAGDLMMVTVLRRIKNSDLLEEFQNLFEYVARGEARPAFSRAFAAQLDVFKDSQKEN
ncbi:MAG: glutathione S-transferase family protein [Alphaproteobacteria bacterium]|nr:glutathione S-transferase family protein [Alphaproteobacteria bacterium]HPF46162.1 glutathione S-transferase family protein [Emcibacteraceae bacterium]HRW28630.1 glutathione S-transferase family protein [Emcibacteraceae bacterium]